MFEALKPGSRSLATVVLNLHVNVVGQSANFKLKRIGSASRGFLATARPPFIRPTFYPRDAMLARVFATATCLSVRLSVTRRYCAWQSECRIVKRTPSDSPITLVSFWQDMTHRKIRKGSPQRNVPNEGGFGFFGDFRPICRHISRTVHFRHKVTMGR